MPTSRQPDVRSVVCAFYGESRERTSMFVITEDKNVAGKADNPRIKQYLASAVSSPDWREKPVEQLMLAAPTLL